jgi:hypothetical protein
MFGKDATVVYLTREEEEEGDLIIAVMKGEITMWGGALGYWGPRYLFITFFLFVSFFSVTSLFFHLAN